MNDLEVYTAIISFVTAIIALTGVLIQVFLVEKRKKNSSIDGENKPHKLRSNPFFSVMLILIIIGLIGGIIWSTTQLNQKGGSSFSTQLLTFNPTDDTMIGKQYTDTIYGARDYMEIRSSSSYTLNGLIKFDVSSIPSDTTIVSATLRLYYWDAGNGDTVGRQLKLYKVTSDWQEGIVVWNTQPSSALQLTTSSIVPSLNNWMSWNVTNDVESFIIGQSPNYGWKITDENGGDLITSFRTREYGTYIPSLEIKIAK